MAKLTPESAWEFADAIKAIVKPQTTRRKATVQNVDKDGTIWVNLPGSSTVTPIQSTGANVSPGDTVLTELRGTSLHITENQTNPAIGENTARSIARQETAHAEAMAKQAQTIADEAQAVAEATNQHFFADDNGAHITDVTQDEWNDAVADNFSDYDPDTKPYHNQLLNSLGILLRTALNNLVSITRSAIAFYDGTGNAASNIVARFGADGAQIGLTDESHLTLDYHSMQLVNKNGLTYLHVSDLRNADGVATFEPRWDLRVSKSSFSLSPPAINTEYTVTVRDADGVNVTGNYTITKHTTRFFVSPIVPSGYVVHAVYDSSNTATAFSFNNRSSAYSVGSKSASFADFGAAQGESSLAAGYTSKAMGHSSVALGLSCEAHAAYSAALCQSTVTTTTAQTALGRYNDIDTSGDYALIIGNGTADYARSNAMAVDWDGYLYPCNEKMPDFVVAQGTSGIWTYRKWHSGIMECWGTYTASIAVNASSGAYSSYRSGLITAPAYPFAFTAKPVATAIVSSGSSGAWVNNAQDATAANFKFYLSAGGSLAAASRGVSIHAIGRWK